MTYTIAATITWDDGVDSPRTFSLSADALNAIEAFRLTVISAPGGPPRYASVVAIIQAYLNQYLVVPAIEANQPPAVQQAYEAYVAALQAAITGGQIQ